MISLYIELLKVKASNIILDMEKKRISEKVPRAAIDAAIQQKILKKDKTNYWKNLTHTK